MRCASIWTAPRTGSERLTGFSGAVAFSAPSLGRQPVVNQCLQPGFLPGADALRVKTIPVMKLRGLVQAGTVCTVSESPKPDLLGFAGAPRPDPVLQNGLQTSEIRIAALRRYS